VHFDAVCMHILNKHLFLNIHEHVCTGSEQYGLGAIAASQSGSQHTTGPQMPSQVCACMHLCNIPWIHRMCACVARVSVYMLWIVVTNTFQGDSRVGWITSVCVCIVCVFVRMRCVCIFLWLQSSPSMQSMTHSMEIAGLVDPGDDDDYEEVMMCVCMYVCMWVCVCARMRTCACERGRVWVCESVIVCERVSVSVSVSAYEDIVICVCRDALMCVP